MVKHNRHYWESHFDIPPLAEEDLEFYFPEDVNEPLLPSPESVSLSIAAEDQHSLPSTPSPQHTGIEDSVSENYIEYCLIFDKAQSAAWSLDIESSRNLIQDYHLRIPGFALLNLEIEIVQSIVSGLCNTNVDVAKSAITVAQAALEMEDIGKLYSTNPNNLAPGPSLDSNLYLEQYIRVETILCLVECNLYLACFYLKTSRPIKAAVHFKDTLMFLEMAQNEHSITKPISQQPFHKCLDRLKEQIYDSFLFVKAVISLLQVWAPTIEDPLWKNLAMMSIDEGLSSCMAIASRKKTKSWLAATAYLFALTVMPVGFMQNFTPNNSLFNSIEIITNLFSGSPAHGFLTHHVYLKLGHLEKAITNLAIATHFVPSADPNPVWISYGIAHYLLLDNVAESFKIFQTMWTSLQIKRQEKPDSIFAGLFFGLLSSTMQEPGPNIDELIDQVNLQQCSSTNLSFAYSIIWYWKDLGIDAIPVFVLLHRLGYFQSIYAARDSRLMIKILETVQKMTPSNTFSKVCSLYIQGILKKYLSMIESTAIEADDLEIALQLHKSIEAKYMEILPIAHIQFELAEIYAQSFPQKARQILKIIMKRDVPLSFSKTNRKPSFVEPRTDVAIPELADSRVFSISTSIEFLQRIQCALHEL